MSADGYAGDITPKAAWQALNDDPGAVLVDVRTVPEWQFVGAPDLSGIGKQALFIAWKTYPSMDVNEGFAASVKDGGAAPDQPVYLLCRSGVRSIAAAQALTRAGFTKAYNVLEGFEGDKDAAGHRGGLGGWRHHGLPWTQQ